MTRTSRPPGFDMTFRPVEKFFGPPFLARLPALIHATLAALLIAFVYWVERGPTDSPAYEYMFRQKHMMETHTAARFFALSSVFSILRDGMRGVKIRRNWIEFRELVSAVWPRVRRYRWAQIDQIVFEKSGRIRLDVWDGTREILPPVKDPRALRTALERLATARAIPHRGGQGVDDLELSYEADDSLA